ncbi:TPA: cytochrome c oxidase assembly protein [Vibrio vulnificus]|nr:cytochrome c oxidase assembly protein [Vibrio vulnificus]HDY7784138.1 cytochrome c oxidase assembly protein [Vibrio vulnificus]HDY7786780.1 cytochrome c oxidase assembly protein [Vibrio vulnificus]HDY7793503.1 cytochrome c oxidase assembly protein [Vibrio vulnificus]HDY7795920.1 cytochrome c oxidase assembly protein [Vibrio vulnificus]
MMTGGRSNRILTLKLTMAALAMFGFGFALVPLYDVMCDVLGINGKTDNVAVAAPVGLQIDTSRTIRVEFMAHVAPDMPWSFKPQSVTLNVHPGEVIQTAYLAQNLSQEILVGQAVPSVSPGQGAAFFNKIECFCFNRQPIEGNQLAQMPLIFYIEPDLPAEIHTLTLSYTLYRLPVGQADREKLAQLSGLKEATNPLPQGAEL